MTRAYGRPPTLAIGMDGPVGPKELNIEQRPIQWFTIFESQRAQFQSSRFGAKAFLVGNDDYPHLESHGSRFQNLRTRFRETDCNSMELLQCQPLDLANALLAN